MTKMNFRKLAEEFMENSLFAPTTLNYGVLATDGKIYYTKKRTTAEMIKARGSISGLPCDVVAGVSPSNYVGDLNSSTVIYKNGNSFIRVLNKNAPVQIAANG